MRSIRIKALPASSYSNMLYDLCLTVLQAQTELVQREDGTPRLRMGELIPKNLQV